jgi:hypothetical protein
LIAGPLLRLYFRESSGPIFKIAPPGIRSAQSIQKKSKDLAVINSHRYSKTFVGLRFVPKYPPSQRSNRTVFWTIRKPDRHAYVAARLHLTWYSEVEACRTYVVNPAINAERNANGINGPHPGGKCFLDTRLSAPFQRCGLLGS